MTIWQVVDFFISRRITKGTICNKECDYMAGDVVLLLFHDYICMHMHVEILIVNVEMRCVNYRCYENFA